jgi:hypothetical protein
MRTLAHRAATPQLCPPTEALKLPEQLVPRLAAEGVHSLTDWRRLGHRRKRSIFGITAAHVRQLDALARAQG